MDVVTTSLEALLQRMMNPQNQNPDIAAIEAFCAMINKEVEGIQIAIKLLSSGIHSNIEWQALQALTLLDICMQKCGPLFHSEVGKFRFLNEMIKLVSPKYLGNTTSLAIKKKVFNLLESWTVQYPREIKIKEAYEMLKKQEIPKSDSIFINNSLEDITPSVKTKNPIFNDEEKSKLLRKLLQSKNPEDLHAANKLIKAMVKEDEKRIQHDSRIAMELEYIHNNVKLLLEMLDSYSYSQDQNDKQNVELIKELYETCERSHPTIERLAQEINDNEDVLVYAISASEDLDKVRNKYANILFNQSLSSLKHNIETDQTLLDLSISNETSSTVFEAPQNINITTNFESDIELLKDIFEPAKNSTDTVILYNPELSLPNISVTQPTTVTNTLEKDNKDKLFDDMQQFKKFTSRNVLSNFKLEENTISNYALFDDAVKQAEILQKINVNIESKLDKTEGISSNYHTKSNSYINEVKDVNLLCCDENFTTEFSKINLDIENNPDIERSEAQIKSYSNELEVESLASIHINLKAITPGPIPPLTVMKEKNGVTIVLHFAKDIPRFDVSVIVITTTNTNSKILKDYLFQVVVPKKCKCRLQSPSADELPAYNPFLPTSAITQIMLIANPYKEIVSLKFMLSYSMDGDTITEMGEIDRLPIT